MSGPVPLIDLAPCFDGSDRPGAAAALDEARAAARAAAREFFAVPAAVIGATGIGPHTDFGTFTVLDREPGRGGLQVLDDEHGRVDAPHEDLVSLVYFYELDPDTVVESLGPPVGHHAAPPVRAADYLADKLAAITVP